MSWIYVWYDLKEVFSDFASGLKHIMAQVVHLATRRLRGKFRSKGSRDIEQLQQDLENLRYELWRRGIIDQQGPSMLPGIHSTVNIFDLRTGLDLLLEHLELSLEFVRTEFSPYFSDSIGYWALRSTKEADTDEVDEVVNDPHGDLNLGV